MKQKEICYFILINLNMSLYILKMFPKFSFIGKQIPTKLKYLGRGDGRNNLDSLVICLFQALAFILVLLSLTELLNYQMDGFYFAFLIFISCAGNDTQ